MESFPPIPNLAANRSALRVLVVDDTVDFAESLAWLLRDKGYEAHTAGDVMDAVAAIVRQRFDVIFLDIRMPGLSGYDLARWVKAHCGARPPYMIAVTGYKSDADWQRAAEIGIEKFLLKPLDPTQLDDLLSQARAGR